MNEMTPSSTLIIDANVALSLVLYYPNSDAINRLWVDWVQRNVEITAPQLWIYEVTSAIHKLFMLNQISRESAKAALEAILSLDVRLVEVDYNMCQSAYDWATRLNQLATYDSFYLALAERMDAEFWTSDRHLVNAVRQLGVGWVYLLGN